MSCWYDNRKHTIWLLDDNARLDPHASATSWTEHRNIQCRLGYSSNLEIYVITGLSIH